MYHGADVAFFKAVVDEVAIEYNGVEFFYGHGLILWIRCYESGRGFSD